MDKPHQIALSHDEALVLFELFSRFQETNQLSVENNAEFIALSTISAQLDTTLVEPFRAGYAELLQQAQDRLAKGGDVSLPGVPGYEP